MARNKNFSGGRLVFYIFSLLLFIGVIYYFAEIRKEILLIRSINIFWFVAAILAQALTYVLLAYVYQTILTGFGVKDPPALRQLFKVSIISLFFNQTMPSAGVSGNVFLFNYLTKEKVGAGQVIAIILSELFIYYAAMMAFILCCLGIYFIRAAPSVVLPVLLTGFGVLLVFSVVLVLAGRKRSLDLIFRKLKKLRFLHKYMERMESRMAALKGQDNGTSLISFLKQKKYFLKIFTGQVFIIALDSLTILLLFQGFGFPVTYTTILLGFICTKLISILPFTPGALILYESSMVFFYNLSGVPVGVALMVTLLYRLLSFWIPIPTGLFLYRRWLKLSG